MLTRLCVELEQSSNGEVTARAWLFFDGSKAGKPGAEATGSGARQALEKALQGVHWMMEAEQAKARVAA